MSPRADLVDECVAVGNAAIQALAGEHAEFGLGHVEPTAVFRGVMNLQLGGQPLGFGGWKRLVQRSRRVDVQLVYDQDNLLDVGEMHVDQVLDDVREVSRRSMSADYDLSPAA